MKKGSNHAGGSRGEGGGYNAAAQHRQTASSVGTSLKSRQGQNASTVSSGAANEASGGGGTSNHHERTGYHQSGTTKQVAKGSATGGGYK